MKAMGDYFIFNNINSENYNIIVGSESAVEDVSFGLNRTIIKSEVNKYREKVNMLGTTNDEVITFDFILMKNPCNNNSSLFTTEELRTILAWITSPHYPCLFKWGDKNKGDLPYEYFGIFTEVTSFNKGDDVYGIKVKFETNSSYAYSPILSETFNVVGSMDFELSNNSDNYYDYVYPTLEITPYFTGDLTIKNVTDSDKSITISVLENNTITIDCEKFRIFDDAGVVDLYDLGIRDVDYIYWVRLANGLNVFSITGGNVDITFNYRECYKLGIFN